ncbi:MAG TPA: hypothetical protein VGZ47_10860, partial [Gemmataceae bacterium]|nr:hypothetical protein [Gemmataceae bacterium]
IRFPLAGASGKDSNCQALGSMRTYAFVPKSADAAVESRLQYSDWMEAVRTGATFITSGPLLQFTVDGQPPGSILDLSKKDEPQLMVARMESAVPAGPLEIICNGEVVAEAPDGQTLSALVAEVPDSGSCWLAARCLPSSQPAGLAHTSPVFVRYNGQMPSNAAVMRNYFEALQRTANWVETAGRFEKPRRKELLLAILKQAQQALLARLQ